MNLLKVNPQFQKFAQKKAKGVWNPLTDFQTEMPEFVIVHYDWKLFPALDARKLKEEHLFGS